MEKAAVEPYRYDKEVIRQTVRQIEKDFGLSGVPLAEAPAAIQTFGQLCTWVSPAIATILRQSPSRIETLLYRIGAAERTYKEIRSQPIQVQAQMLAEWIAELEFLKVVARQIQSGKQ